jgi:hypothetical protein
MRCILTHTRVHEAYRHTTRHTAKSEIEISKSVEISFSTVVHAVVSTSVRRTYYYTYGIPPIDYCSAVLQTGLGIPSCSTFTKRWDTGKQKYHVRLQAARAVAAAAAAQAPRTLLSLLVVWRTRLMIMLRVRVRLVLARVLLLVQLHVAARSSLIADDPRSSSLAHSRSLACGTRAVVMVVGGGRGRARVLREGCHAGRIYQRQVRLKFAKRVDDVKARRVPCKRRPKLPQRAEQARPSAPAQGGEVGPHDRLWIEFGARRDEAPQCCLVGARVRGHHQGRARSDLVKRPAHLGRPPRDPQVVRAARAVEGWRDRAQVERSAKAEVGAESQHEVVPTARSARRRAGAPSAAAAAAAPCQRWRRCELSDRARAVDDAATSCEEALSDVDASEHLDNLRTQEEAAGGQD